MMNLSKRVYRSIKDGSFAIKTLNRLSRTKYVPSQDFRIDKFLTAHYPGDGWSSSLPAQSKSGLIYGLCSQHLMSKPLHMSGQTTAKWH